MIAAMRVPLIAVTPGHAGPSAQREFCRTAEVVYCDLSYLRCVEAAGGIPVLLHPGDGELLEAIEKRLDGLLLTGGEDVHPHRYGQEWLTANGAVSELRDAFEIALLKRFIASGKPVLAICRGVQVLNVALGGTLLQDLPVQTGQTHHTQRAATTVATHEVRLEPHSRVARVFESVAISVNSHHHQAVDRVADELQAAGWSEEGIVEAVEHRGGSWVVGVQWHPERLAATHGIQQRLFDHFVRACQVGEASGR